MGRRSRERGNERRHREAVKWTRIGAVAAVIAIPVAIALALLPRVTGNGSPSSPSTHSTGNRVESRPAGNASVSVEQILVRNREFQGRSPDDGATIVQSKASLPAIELALLNRGPHRVLVTQAVLSIARYAELNPCVGINAEGPLRVSAGYQVALPVGPLRERTVRVPLDQQIGPDHADRFALRFATRKPSELREDLYALDIQLQTSDGGRLVSAGKAVIAVPGALGTRAHAGVYLPLDDETLSTFADPRLSPEATSCFVRNVVAAGQVLRTPGTRSSEMGAVDYLRPAPAWQKLQDPTAAH